MKKIQKFVIISLIVMVFCIPASSFSGTISNDTEQTRPMIKFENIISNIEDTNSIYDSFFNVYDSNNELVYSTCNPDGLITLNQPDLSYSDISVDELPYFEISLLKSWWAESLLKYFPKPDESIRLDTYSMRIVVKNVGGDLPITEWIKLNFTVEIDSYPYYIPTFITISTNYWPHNFSWWYGLGRGYQDPQWFKPNTSLVTANINCTIEDFTQNEINASAPCTYDMRISGNVTSIDVQGDIIPVQSEIFCSVADINFLTITETNNTGAYEVSVYPLDQPTIFMLQALKEGYEHQVEFSEPIYMENDTAVVNLHLNRLNERPYTPQIIGELNGNAGDSYDYTFISGDPNDDYLYYYIDWGDDETEEWIGPFSPEEVVIKSHTWDEEGTYTILCKTKDVLGAESEWSEPVEMIITDLDIEIKSRLAFLTVIIKNNGKEDITDLEWGLGISGIIFRPKDGIAEGVIPVLKAGRTARVRVPVFGLGPVSIGVRVGDQEVTVKGFVIGPLIIVFQGETH